MRFIYNIDIYIYIYIYIHTHVHTHVHTHTHVYDYTLTCICIERYCIVCLFAAGAADTAVGDACILPPPSKGGTCMYVYVYVYVYVCVYIYMYTERERDVMHSYIYVLFSPPARIAERCTPQQHHHKFMIWLHDRQVNGTLQRSWQSAR